MAGSLGLQVLVSGSLPYSSWQVAGGCQIPNKELKESWIFIGCKMICQAAALLDMLTGRIEEASLVVQLFISGYVPLG